MNTPATSHTTLVRQQFGDQARAYLDSAVHAQGSEFLALREAVSASPDARVLDLGCGAGHVAFQIAPLVREVIAYDLSRQMLEVVASAASERGLENLHTARGAAEKLPFDRGEFDFVFSRYSAHHWNDVGLALREVRRVLKPGGTAAFIDVCAPGVALLDTHLQTVELLRDTSHVRDYANAEWQRLLGEAGLQVQHHQMQRLRLDFTSWVTRMRTPAVYVDAIRALWLGAPAEVRDYFEVAEDGSFSTDVIVVWADRR